MYKAEINVTMETAIFQVLFVPPRYFCAMNCCIHLALKQTNLNNLLKSVVVIMRLFLES